MFPPRARSMIPASLAVLVVLTSFSWPVAAQSLPPDPANLRLSWYAEGFLAALATAVVGGLSILFAPRYTRRITDRIHDDPIDSFVWGVGIAFAAVAGVIVTGAMGAVVIAFPALLIFAVVVLVASVLGSLAIGRLVTDERMKGLGIAIVVAALVGAVPIVGGVVGFVVSSIGLGAIVRNYRAEFDRKFETRLLDPPTPHRARVAFDTDGTSVTRFLVQLDYWFDGTLHEVVRFAHDPDGERVGDDVTDAGLHMSIYRYGKEIGFERLTDPLPSEDAFDRAQSHLATDLEAIVEAFEGRHDVDEPMTSEAFDQAAEALRTLRAETRVALAEELGRTS